MTQTLPWPDDFLVNQTTTATQQAGDPVGLSDGSFVVVWTDFSATGADTDLTAIRARIFNADGSPAGDEFVVNSTTTGGQSAPVVTALANGGFVVAWADQSLSGGDTSSSAVRAQVFGLGGVPLGSEFLVNTTTASSQTTPALATLSNGGFVATWVDASATGADTSSLAIRGQIFTANGVKSGPEFVVNSTTENFQFGQSVTALANGRFVVAWTDNSKTGDDTSSYAIRAQVFDANGAKRGSEQIVNISTPNEQYDPEVTALSNGRFVITWSDNSNLSADTDKGAVRAQLFNGLGGKIGGEALVNTSTLNGQYNSSVTALDNGRYVIAWSDASAASTVGFSVAAQVFDANGNREGGEFVVNSTSETNQRTPALATLADGRVIVTFNNDNTGFPPPNDIDVRGRILDLRSAAIDLTGGSTDDWFVGSRFVDQIDGGSGDDMLEGGKGGDTLVGGKGSDRLKGDDGRDKLTGDSGNDILQGGTGDDRLTGGIGADQQTGGAGHDTFIFRYLAESTIGTVGRDRITDFVSGVDTINLAVIDAMSGSGNQAFHWIGTASFTSAKGQLRYDQSGNTTYVQGDVDGDGLADFRIDLKGRLTLDSADFVL